MLKRIIDRSVQRRPAARSLLLAALLIGGSILAAERADACTGVPTPEYTITSVVPGEGAAAVPRDTGIIISGLPSSPSGGPGVFADVTLSDADTNEPRPLRAIAWYALEGAEETLAVHPSEPLEAGRRYRVVATPSMPGVDGPTGPSFVSTFVTSDVLLEPIVLTGQLRFSLRGADHDVTECGTCGSDCIVTGTSRWLLADVQLPVPSGGQGIYRGLLHFTDDTPTRVDPRDPAEYADDDADAHVFHTMQFVKMAAGEALTVEQVIFDEDRAYTGCFTFVVWDPAGHITQTSACLPTLAADEIRTLAGDDAELPLSEDVVLAAEQVRQATAAAMAPAAPPSPGAADDRDNASVAGCALGSRAPTAIPGWVALLLACLSLRRRSR